MEYIKKIVLSDEGKKELNQAKDKLERLDYYNEKVSFLISEWIVDYGFNEKPDPVAAIEWGRRGEEDLHAEQSAKWFWEYNRIFKLVEMMHDYNNIMREILTKEKNGNE